VFVHGIPFSVLDGAPLAALLSVAGPVAEARVADPAVAADHVKMAAACKSLDEAQEKIHTLYVRWQELETKRG
jgi:hypothetical protein